jgi:hypothetical protein
VVGRLRERKYELGRPIGDRILYILPELLAAKKFRDVAPDRVALVCQLQGQPSANSFSSGFAWLMKTVLVSGTRCHLSSTVLYLRWKAKSCGGNLLSAAS